MSKKEYYSSLDEMTYKSLGLVIGLLFGGLVGPFIGNPIVFAGGSMVLGLSIGTALEKRRSKDDSL